MTTEMMIDALEKYCNSRERCDNCELKKLDDFKVNKYIDNYGCVFDGMDEQMIKKIYDWYKEIDLSAHDAVDPKAARHYEICQKLNQVYKAKNHDYGDSFGDTYKKLGIISAVTRLSDKMNRLMSLAIKHDAQVKDEKIEDTLLDMANYAIMTLIELGYEVDE